MDGHSDGWIFAIFKKTAISYIFVHVCKVYGEFFTNNFNLWNKNCNNWFQSRTCINLFNLY